MTAAVLDANVVVSCYGGRQWAPEALNERWPHRDFHLIVSELMLDGAERAWDRPWFRPRLPQSDRDRAFFNLRPRAELAVPATEVHGIAPDREDDLVLAAAIAGNADSLVTGDRRMRAIDRYEGIAIRSPREFIAILDQRTFRS